MNTDDAILANLISLEEQVEQLVLASVTAWLDRVRADVLPSLTAATDTETEPEGGIPPDVAALVAAGAVLWETEIDGVFLPTFAGLLAGIAGAEADQLADWISQHTASVRDRLLGAPAAAVRAVQAAVDEAGPNVPAQRAAARTELTNPRSRTWRSFAARVARTEAAAGFNGVRVAAARVRDRIRAAVDRVRGASSEVPPRLVKRWVTQHDSRVRHSHEEANGQRVELGAEFTVGGFALQYPGDPLGPPSEVINCRCFVVLDEVAANAALAASATPPGGTPVMKTFRANIIPLGVFGRTQGWMLGSTVELVDTVLPQAMKWQKTATPGHDGAYTVAAIESLIVEDGWLVGVGTWLDTPEAAEAAAEVAAGVTRPSVELVGRTEVMTDAAGNPIPSDTAEALMMDGERIGFRIDVAEIVATTLVSVPEFRDASITFADADIDHVAPALTAAPRIIEQPRYDPALFQDPHLDDEVPIHLTADGHVRGYLATWRSLHRGKGVNPYRSASGYYEFHQSHVLLESGERLAVGRLTVGGGHARAGCGIRAAREHYEDIGTAWAFVRAGEDNTGIWVAGVLNPEADEHMIRQALGTPHSGHWEPDPTGKPELIAACGVNVPGFPIMSRHRDREGGLALVASVAPRWSRAHVDTNVLDEVADRAVRRFAEEQQAQARAASAAKLIAEHRTRAWADLIRANHAARGVKVSA